MFYTVYKITNKINGKFYIGCHKTEVLDDGYMGSGKILKRAIKKHGQENFVKEILHVYDSAEAMFAKEKELVYVSEETYNLKNGGDGGFDYINQNGIRNITSESQVRAAKTLKSRRKDNPDMDEKLRKSSRINIQIAHEKGLVVHTGFLGKRHSDETKEVIGRKNKNRVPWNKGIPRTADERKKISESMKTYRYSSTDRTPVS